MSRRLVLAAAQGIGAAFLIRDHVVEIAECSGESMLPTLASSGEYVLINKMASRRHLRRGDVVVSTSPSDPDRMICKRVLGLPGDEVPVGSPWTGLEMVLVPRGHLWLQGDNPSRSLDSREFGPVPMGLLHGRVVCKLWPPRQFLSPL